MPEFYRAELVALCFSPTLDATDGEDYLCGKLSL